MDNSPALLRFAASKDRSVRWAEGDMRNFDLEERFALIMLPSNNLCHLHTVDDFRGCIAACGAIFCQEDLNLLLHDAREESLLSEYEDPRGNGRVRVVARSRYESSTQIRRTTTVRKIAGRPDEIGSLDLKMYFPRG